MTANYVTIIRLEITTYASQLCFNNWPDQFSAINQVNLHTLLLMPDHTGNIAHWLHETYKHTDAETKLDFLKEDMKIQTQIIME